MIDIRQLEFRYAEGDFRLKIPALDVVAGSSSAIIGPSGSGKTTLLSLVAGICLPLAGRVDVDGRQISALGDAERRNFRIANVGLVFQDFELLEYLNVLDNILHPYRINRALRLDRAVRSRARQLADETGIADKLRRFPEQLSQGEKQRAAICRALLTRPKLLLADEPTGNLDPASKGRVLELLFDYADANRATLLMVTHDHSLLEGFDRVIDLASYHVKAPA